MKQKAAKKRGPFFLRILISLLALAVLTYALREKLGKALLILKSGLQWEWFFLAAGVYLVAFALIAWRLQWVLKVQEVRANFRQVLYVSFLGQFFNLFFPSAVGGDVAKGYFLYQYSRKKLASVTGVLLDRIFGLVTIILIIGGAVLVYSRNLADSAMKQSLYHGLYAALGLIVLGTLFFFNHGFAQKFHFLTRLIPSQEWRKNLSDFYHGIRHYRHHKLVLVVCFAISFVAQLLFFADGYLLTRSLKAAVPLWPFFVLMPLVTFASMAPSLSGLGVREAAIVLLFRPFLSAEEALAFALLYDILFYGYSFAAGLLFAFKGGLRRELIQEITGGRA